MPVSRSARRRRAPRAAISASASATASRAPAAARSNAASCASAAPAASRSTPARCRWGRASRPRWRRSAPSSSACRRDDVTVVAGDTAVIPHGQGGFASRQTITAGSAVHMAAVAVREKALTVAAHLLEASPQDLEMQATAAIEVAGTDRRITLAGGGRGGVRRAGLRHAGQFRAGPRKHAELHPERAHLRHRLPRRRGRGRHRHLRRAHPALRRGQRLRPRHQSDDRRGPDRRRRGARHRQFAAGMDGATTRTRSR